MTILGRIVLLVHTDLHWSFCVGTILEGLHHGDVVEGPLVLYSAIS